MTGPIRVLLGAVLGVTASSAIGQQSVVYFNTDAAKAIVLHVPELRVANGRIDLAIASGAGGTLAFFADDKELRLSFLSSDKKASLTRTFGPSSRPYATYLVSTAPATTEVIVDDTVRDQFAQFVAQTLDGNAVRIAGIYSPTSSAKVVFIGGGAAGATQSGVAVCLFRTKRPLAIKMESVEIEASSEFIGSDADSVCTMPFPHASVRKWFVGGLGIAAQTVNAVWTIGRRGTWTSCASKSVAPGWVGKQGANTNADTDAALRSLVFRGSASAVRPGVWGLEC